MPRSRSSCRARRSRSESPRPRARGWSYQKALATLPLNLSQKRLGLAKLKHDHTRAVEKLADLRRDREAMTVHAPADGIVYYGRNDHGTWPGAAAVSSKLRKGGVIMADEVFITVVPPRPLAHPDHRRREGPPSSSPAGPS